MSFDRISKALLYAAAHYQEQPSLEDLASQAGLSPAHFQRSFQRLVGLSPKSFVQHLTAKQAAASLRSGSSVLAASLDSGLSGPGRLHDLIVQVEGASPGEVASGGKGLLLQSGLVPTPWGSLFAAKAPRGLAFAAFIENPSAARAKAELRRLWPKAKISPQIKALKKGPGAALARQGQAGLLVAGQPFPAPGLARPAARPLREPHQLPGPGPGRRPQRSQGRGSAVAANPLALLIPCHRVVRASGALGEYHWGSARKRGLLAREAALRPPAPEGFSLSLAATACMISAEASSSSVIQMVPIGRSRAAPQQFPGLHIHQARAHAHMGRDRLRGLHRHDADIVGVARDR